LRDARRLAGGRQPNPRPARESTAKAEPVMVSSDVRGMPRKAETGAALRERGRHAAGRADAVKQGADRPVVLLQRVRAVHVETRIDAVRRHALACRPQQAERITGVVDDIERGDDANVSDSVLFEQPISRRVAKTGDQYDRKRSL
jgi:hypothetical protein